MSLLKVKLKRAHFYTCALKASGDRFHADISTGQKFMEQYGKWVVGAAFLFSCVLTVWLILHRPYLFIRTRRRHIRVETYFLGALFGPLIIMAFGALRLHDVMAGLNGHGGVNPAGILALFLSMVFISIFLDITGAFEYCAKLALKYAGNDGRRLFFSLYVTVSLLTIVTSNDIIILTFTPLVYYFTRHAKVNPVPYLVAEFFAANTWSMLLYVGNPTNILVASAFRLDFVQYAKWMALPTLAAGSVNAIGLYLLFHREISRPLAPFQSARPADAITDLPGAVMGTALLLACITGLAVAPRLGVEMWVVSMTMAFGLLGVLIARRSWARFLGRDMTREGGTGVRRTLGRMPWTIIPFVLSMFITVESLRRYGITEEAGRFLERLCGESLILKTFVYGASSTVAANLLNNIPMTLAYSSIIQGEEGRALLAAALSTAAGSNLGANLTPLGALAGIMWMCILKEKEVRVGFFQFIKYGLAITPASLAACLGVLAAQMAFF
ncbi:MAG TPA: ArsB/NhaD family transporter [Candidatus Sumerlaeota bacterium]|nr:ArsB/NhaD family transporter [Candidatus Sumerlaeota bacterium]